MGYLFIYLEEGRCGDLCNGSRQLAVVLDGGSGGGWQWMIGRLDCGMGMGWMDRLRLVTRG